MEEQSEIEIIDTIRPIPKPKIKLQANKYLQLSFMYDKYEIKPYPFTEFTIRQTIHGNIKIIRNNEFEKNIIKQIEEFGFKDLENTFIPNGEGQEKFLVWKNFLNKLDELDGYEIEYDNFNLEFRDDSEISVESEDEKQWFSLSFEIKIGRKKYPLLPIIVPILKEIKSLDELPEKMTLPYEETKFITINTKEVKPILTTIFELLD